MTIEAHIQEPAPINADLGNVTVDTSAGTGGTMNHEKLVNRDKANQHPMSAITGLLEALAGKITRDELGTVLDEAAKSGKFDGADGFSPTVSVEAISGGHRVTITDKDGPHVFEVKDGAEGGSSGGGGSGEDGGFYTPSVSPDGILSWSGSKVGMPSVPSANVKGGQGDAGVGISSIKRTGGNGAAGSVDTYTITLTNGQTSTFTVRNGSNGKDGTPADYPVQSVNGQTGIVNLSIPTKTSELTNDSGFLDTKPTYTAGEITGLSEVAKTGSYTDLTDKPTIGGIDKEDVVQLTSDFAPLNSEAGIDYTPRIVRCGAVVYMEGIAGNTRTLSFPNSGAEYKVATLPAWARPRTSLSVLQQGSSVRVFWLRIQPNGDVIVSRNRDANKYVDANVGNQWPLGESWITSAPMA